MTFFPGEVWSVPVIGYDRQWSQLTRKNLANLISKYIGIKVDWGISAVQYTIFNMINKYDISKLLTPS